MKQIEKLIDDKDIIMRDTVEKIKQLTTGCELIVPDRKFEKHIY